MSYDGRRFTPIFHSEISSSHLLFDIFDEHKAVAAAFIKEYYGLFACIFISSIGFAVFESFNVAAIFPIVNSILTGSDQVGNYGKIWRRRLPGFGFPSCKVKGFATQSELRIY